MARPYMKLTDSEAVKEFQRGHRYALDCMYDDGTWWREFWHTKKEVDSQYEYWDSKEKIIMLELNELTECGKFFHEGFGLQKPIRDNNGQLFLNWDTDLWKICGSEQPSK